MLSRDNVAVCLGLLFVAVAVVEVRRAKMSEVYFVAIVVAIWRTSYLAHLCL